jgi:preprotein translocase subunit SecA
MFKTAIPGPVWGCYPQRAMDSIGAKQSTATSARLDTKRRNVDHRYDFSSKRLWRHLAHRSLTLALELTNNSSNCLSPSELKYQLRRDGLKPQTVGIALAHAAAIATKILGQSPYLSQLDTACLLIQQRLVELPTGEGKTLSAALASVVLALSGAPVHLLTANEYLAQRDGEKFNAFFKHFDLQVGVSLESHSADERRQAYQADVVYSTARCIAFDYLRDRLAMSNRSAQTQPLLLRGLCCAILDEADHTLLDEAKTPLVIAQAIKDPQQRAQAWLAINQARALKPIQDYQIIDGRIVFEPSFEKQLNQQVHSPWLAPFHRQEYLHMALHALHQLHLGIHYVVKDDEIAIIDQSTGRIAQGKQWSKGLHAIVCVKEGIKIADPTITNASITFARLLNRYHHLSGLSGTLQEGRHELSRVFGLKIAVVTPNFISQSKRLALRWFETDTAAFEALRTEVAQLTQTQRSVLIATNDVNQTNQVAGFLRERGFTAICLSASNDANEASTIQQAGQCANVLVATQMAGRGTDIHLSPHLLKAGGLHVINWQTNRSPRIDRQVTGRAARQGQPGSSQHWIIAPYWLAQAKAQLGTFHPWIAKAAVAPMLSPTTRARVVLKMFQAIAQQQDLKARNAALKADEHWSKRLLFASIRE